MNLSIEFDALEDGTAALVVDGTRIAYVRPLKSGSGIVDITVVPYNEFGLSPIRQPRFRSHVAAAGRRQALKRRRKEYDRPQEVA